MKLRIKGNSIRFRLMQDEVSSFLQNGRIAESCTIGPLEILTFELVISESYSAGFLGNILSVHVPKETFENWAKSEQINMETTINNGTEKALRILIEKDFACLTVREGEDESNAFPNPNKSC